MILRPACSFLQLPSAFPPLSSSVALDTLELLPSFTFSCSDVCFPHFQITVRAQCVRLLYFELLDDQGNERLYVSPIRSPAWVREWAFSRTRHLPFQSGVRFGAYEKVRDAQRTKRRKLIRGGCQMQVDVTRSAQGGGQHCTVSPGGGQSGSCSSCAWSKPWRRAAALSVEWVAKNVGGWVDDRTDGRVGGSWAGV